MELSYFNARVRGLKGRLFGPSQYSAFLKAYNVEDYLSLLVGTHYGPSIERARRRFPSAGLLISRALAEDLSDTFALLGKASPEEAGAALKTLLYVWEAFSLKALIRGIERGAPFEELLDIVIPAGEFDRNALAMLSRSKGVPDLISFLETWGSAYAAPLKEGLTAYSKRRSVLELELKIDSYMPRSLLSAFTGGSSDDSIIREHLSLRIDIINIMTLLKTAGEGYSREGLAGFFVEGGEGGANLDKDLFISLAGLKGREEIIKGLIERMKYPPFAEALKGADYDEPWLLEEALVKTVEARLKRASIVEPLSIALAASYIYMKVREIKNLRLIARGKIFGIPEGELKRLLL